MVNHSQSTIHTINQPRKRVANFPTSYISVYPVVGCLHSRAFLVGCAALFLYLLLTTVDTINGLSNCDVVRFASYQVRIDTSSPARAHLQQRRRLHPGGRPPAPVGGGRIRSRPPLDGGHRTCSRPWLRRRRTEMARPGPVRLPPGARGDPPSRRGRQRRAGGVPRPNFLSPPPPGFPLANSLNNEFGFGVRNQSSWPHRNGAADRS